MKHAAQAIPPVFTLLGTTTATLNFFDGRSAETNYHWTGTNESERPMNFTPPDPHECQIQDLRELSATVRDELGFTLEKAGFEVVHGWGPHGEEIGAAWGEGKWKDKSWIEGNYYAYVKRGAEYMLSMD